MRRFALSLVLLLCVAAPDVRSHHSPAMFDGQRLLSLSGTVREFQWINPHCYVQLLVQDAAGRSQEWSLEMGATLYLYNRGWRPSTLKPGDAITVRVAPLRNGGNAGLLLEATRADGRPVAGTQP